MSFCCDTQHLTKAIPWTFTDVSCDLETPQVTLLNAPPINPLIDAHAAYGNQQHHPSS